MDVPEVEGEDSNAVDTSMSYLRMLAERRALPYRQEESLGQIGAVGSDGGPPGISGLVPKLFGDKVKAEKAVVRQLLNEIVLREQIHRDAINQIDVDMCSCGTWLLEIRAITEGKYLQPEESLEFGQRRSTLEMKVLDLENEKRAEESSAWSDLSTLRRYLLFALRDYWNAARRSELLRWGQDMENETVSE